MRRGAHIREHGTPTVLGTRKIPYGGKNVNKNEFIGAVAERFDNDRKAAQQAVDAVLDTIKQEVAKGEKVALSGFGIFEKSLRNARTARNPQDGSLIKLKAKNVPKFRAGAEFKEFVENPRAALKKAREAAKKAPARTTAAAKKTTTAAKKTTATAAKTAATASKTAAKKTTTAAKKAPAKTTTAAKKTTTAAKKAPAKTTAAAKKAPAKTTAAAKKAPAKKAPAKTTAAKKAPAKKAPAKTTARKR